MKSEVTSISTVRAASSEIWKNQDEDLTRPDLVGVLTRQEEVGSQQNEKKKKKRVGRRRRTADQQSHFHSLSCHHATHGDVMEVPQCRVTQRGDTGKKTCDLRVVRYISERMFEYPDSYFIEKGI